MKTTSLLLILSATMAANAGCKARQVCKEHPSLCEEGGSGTGGGSQGGNGGSGGAGGQGGQGGDGGGVPAGCELSEGEAVGADCGVFVKAGSTGDGSQGSPYSTIQDAVENIKTFERIYVCGGDIFNGSIELPGGVSIFGALDCDGWKFAEANAKPLILGDADVPALAVSESGTTRIDHIDVQSPNAVATGASSIAVLVRITNVTLDHCALTAGDGAKGEAGAPYGAIAQSGGVGAPGAVGCEDNMTNAGGNPGTNPVCTDQTGGLGGAGQSSGSGGPGGPGDPNLMGGIAGTPQSGSSCTAGGQGDDGGPGDPGLAGSGIGQLEGSDYTPAPAPPAGGPGDPGYGGGGGGGAHRCELTPTAGPGGGGGGAGGCGGAAGRGGLGGGASFALAVITAEVTIVDSVLTAGAGGEGGNGGAGQTGGLGGDGGPKGVVNGSNNSGADACAGGKGGAGGRGGAAGGGAGGPSAAIARVDSTVDRQGNVVATAGSSGAGGFGGDNEGQGSSGPQGDAGAVCEVLVFDGSTSGQCNNG